MANLGGVSGKVSQILAAMDSNAFTESSPQAQQPDCIKIPLRAHQKTLLAGALELETHASRTVLFDESVATDHSKVVTSDIITEYGIIGDRVGSGKSLVALSLAVAPSIVTSRLETVVVGGASYTKRYPYPEFNDIAQHRDLPGPAFMRKLLEESPDSNIHTKTALFIIPHYVMHQWMTYVKEQTTLRAVFIRRTVDCDNMRPGFFQDMMLSDAVFVSITMFCKFAYAMSSSSGPRFSRIVWSRLFIDEADQCNGIEYRDISARFTWLISGSYLNFIFPYGLSARAVECELTGESRMRIGNGAIEGLRVPGRGIVATLVGGRVSHLMQPMFTRVILRNSEAWINKSLTAPTVTHREVRCRALVTANLLKGFVPDNVLEALHAGDTAAAIHLLGGEATTVSKTGLIERVKSSFVTQLDNATKELEFRQTKTYSSPAAKAAGVAAATEHVAKITAKIAGLEQRLAEETDSGALCPICYDAPDPAATAMTPCCNKSFCLDCICTCIKTAKGASGCPMCRAPLRSVKELLIIQADKVDDEEAEEKAKAKKPELPSKEKALLTLLTATLPPTSRILLFASHEAVFAPIKKRLNTGGIPCQFLSGTAASISKRCKDFQKGTVRVLCLNARHMGAGLNLDAATHVVLYNKLNIELEKQVIGRAIRFERTEPLEVIHLTHVGETALNSSAVSCIDEAEFDSAAEPDVITYV